MVPENLPIALAVGDLNGDGILDILVCNFDSNNVTELLGRGNGSFQRAGLFSVGAGPNSIAVGDFNGDGKLDAVTANENDNTLSVLLNTGSGFRKATTYPSGGVGSSSVIVDDFNADGKLDMAVINGCVDSMCFAQMGLAVVFLGKGDGTFQGGASYPANWLSSFLVSGDLNGDGKPDLVVLSGLGFSVGVLLGNGDGTFQSEMTLALSYFPGQQRWQISTVITSWTLWSPILTVIR